jgi:hypothetical protein
MLIAKEHREKAVADVEEESEVPELTPEYALAPDGNGNGWKQA